MVDFGELKDKAQGLVGEHADQIKQGIDKVGDFVGDKIGHDKVDPIEEKLTGFVDGLGGGSAEQPAAEQPAPAEAPAENPPAQ